MAALPSTARPARHVRPTMRPSRLRMQEMRCSVRSIPALLSSPKSPSCIRQEVYSLLTMAPVQFLLAPGEIVHQCPGAWTTRGSPEAM